MQILLWAVVVVLLALWSALAAGVHALLSIDPSWVGSVKPLIDQVPYGAVIEQWIPGWRELLIATADLTQALLRWAGGAGVVIVWITWGIGAVLLLVLGGLGSVLIAMARRAGRAAAPAAPNAPPRRAA